MTYFISGHRDITPEEFEKFYVPAIVDVIDTCNNNYDDCEFVVGDCRGCDEMAAMDEGDCVWVAGCTIQNVDTEVYIEEYSADVENGFSRQVTFYEKD